MLFVVLISFRKCCQKNPKSSGKTNLKNMQLDSLEDFPKYLSRNCDSICVHTSIISTSAINTRSINVRKYKHTCRTFTCTRNRRMTPRDVHNQNNEKKLPIKTTFRKCSSSGGLINFLRHVWYIFPGTARLNRTNSNPIGNYACVLWPYKQAVMYVRLIRVLQTGWKLNGQFQIFKSLFF